jgi:Protein of unknown function (DUF2975)
MEPKTVSRAVSLGHGLLTFLLVAAVVFSAYLLVDTAVGAVNGGHRPFGGRELDARFDLNPDEIKLPPGIRDEGWLPVRVHLKHPTGKQVLLTGVPDLIKAIPFIIGLVLMRGLTRSVKQGNPFSATNVTRLRGIGYLCVVGAFAVAFINSGFRTALFNDLPPQPADIGVAGFTPSAGAIVAGLGAFILAEVFAHGLRLREDVEGTV